jgi:hypothetical protein
VEKKLLYKVLSYLGFITSAIFTYLSYVNESSIMFDKVLACCMTLCTQGGSFIFFYHATQKKKKAYMIMAILLFLLSIYATTDYQAKKQDNTSRKDYANSEEYNQSKLQKQLALENRGIAINDKKVLNDDIKSVRLDIKSVKSRYNTQINSLVTEKNKVKANWRKEQIDIEIRNLNKEMNTIIKPKETLLESKINESKNINTTVNLNEYNVNDEVIVKISNSSMGIISRFKGWFGWDEMFLSFLKQVLFSIIFECTAIFFHLLSCESQVWSAPRKPEKPLHAMVTQTKKADLKIVKCSPQPQSKIDKIDNADAKKYVDKLYESAKGGKHPEGYKKVSRLAGVHEEKVGNVVFQHLKFTGAVKVINGKTTILKDRGEVAI